MLRWCAAMMPMFWCSLIGQVGAGAPHFMQWVSVGSANAMVHRTTRAGESFRSARYFVTSASSTVA